MTHIPDVRALAMSMSSSFGEKDSEANLAEKAESTTRMKRKHRINPPRPRLRRHRNSLQPEPAEHEAITRRNNYRARGRSAMGQDEQ